MKNVHIIERPTIEILGVSPYGKSESDYKIECFLASRNIHITSDEYIGLSWYLDGDLVRKGVIDDKDYWSVRKDYKKIIMTTDKKLIKDGVQPIPDEFLKWYVENPSCEEIYVDSWTIRTKNRVVYNPPLKEYEIIIPNEEPKCTCKVGEPYNNTCCKVHGNLNDDFENSLSSFKETLNKKYDDSVLTLQLTKKEARGLLTCLMRTSAKGTDLDVGEMVEEQLVKFLKI